MKVISKPKRLFMLFCLLGAVTGCAPLKPSTEVVVAPNQNNAIPANLMAPCDPLPQFSGSNTNPSDLVGYNISIMQAYGKCSMKLKNLQNWVVTNS